MQSVPLFSSANRIKRRMLTEAKISEDSINCSLSYTFEKVSEVESPQAEHVQRENSNIEDYILICIRRFLFCQKG